MSYNKNFDENKKVIGDIKLFEKLKNLHKFWKVCIILVLLFTVSANLLEIFTTSIIISNTIPNKIEVSKPVTYPGLFSICWFTFRLLYSVIGFMCCFTFFIIKDSKEFPWIE